MGALKLDNDVSQVLNRTDLIENILNQIIISYSAPRKEAYNFFRDVLLDSSIVSLGSKLKVAKAISQQLNFKLKHVSLHKVLSLRNAFAHHSLDSHPTLFVGKTDEETEAHYMLHILNSSGKTEIKRREDALKEFNKHFVIAKKSLVELRNTITAEQE